MEKCYFNVHGCTILKKKEDCQTCNFYQTPTQVRLSKENSLRRLRSLPKTTRLNIASKYKVEGIV